MTECLAGKKIWIHSLGCRSNQYEGEAIAAALIEEGAELADSPRGCDGAVLVSCTVTSTADKKCRQAARRVRRLSPRSIIAACGCWAQKLSGDEARSLGIDILVGNRRKGNLPGYLSKALRDGGTPFIEDRTDVLRSKEWDDLSISQPLLHTRAFVKIQDGCDHYCAYCAIPYVRGRPVSRDGKEVMAEVERIAASGCSEVVLTGVHLGLYGKDGGLSLGELVRKISALQGISRIRFGSLEPFALDEALLQALGEVKTFCPHLHLPLQSGSAAVLSRMDRGYSPQEFFNLAEKARAYLGQSLHISTDVLVGFPGETDGDFEDTLALMKACRLGKIHVFPFSPREGTKAWSLPGRIPGEVVLHRTARALQTADELLKEYAAPLVGSTVPVLAEETEDDAFRGLTPSFLKVSAQGRAVRGEEAKVAVSSFSGDTLEGARAP